MKIRLGRFLIQLMFFYLFVTVSWGWNYGYIANSFIHSTSFLAALSRTIAQGLSISLLATLLVLIVSVVWGRIYCSYVCPVGFIQDILQKVFRLKKFNGNTFIRYIVFFIALSCVVLQSSFYQYLDHYSIFGKIISGTYVGISYLFFILIIGIVAPRFFCNSICPSGVIFSFLQEKFSYGIAKSNINMCDDCSLCSTKCPSGAISADGKIDYERCIQCFECLEFCTAGKYIYGRRKIVYNNNEPRKKILRGLLAFLFGITLGKLFVLTLKGLRPLSTKNQILPPGAMNYDFFISRCTNCGACINTCPTGVIVYGHSAVKLDYSKTYCTYKCNACSEICPNGALAHVPLDIKKRLQIGKAILDESLCIVETEERNCGACAEFCPTGAVKTKAYGVNKDLLMPVLDVELCIGCGACEAACPVKPKKAILVEPVDAQRFIAKRQKNKKRLKYQNSKFPF